MKYETNLNGNKPKTIKSLILDEKGNPLPLKEEPKRDWLTGWVSKKFPKVMEASNAIGRLPNTLNPVKTLQTLLDFTGVPGVINNIAGNPMNLPADEVEAAMIPVVGGAAKGVKGAEELVEEISKKWDIVNKINAPKNSLTQFNSATPKTTKSIVDEMASSGLIKKSDDGKYIFWEPSGARSAIVVDVEGANIPFYQSTVGTSGKIAGTWYPFFGNPGGGWLIKGGLEGKNSMELGYGIPKIKETMQELNRIFPERDMLTMNYLDLPQREWLRDNSRLLGRGVTPPFEPKFPNIGTNTQYNFSRIGKLIGFDVNKFPFGSDEWTQFEYASEPIFSKLKKKDGGKLVPKHQTGKKIEYTINAKDRLFKQIASESSFNKYAKSGANALGPAQIRKELYMDYVKDTKDTEPYESVMDPEKALKVRNWAITRFQNAPWNTPKKGQTPINKLAKAYAAYNWGPGSLVEYLNKAKKNGEDIYKDTAWIHSLPPETKNYLDRILFDDDPKFLKDLEQFKRKPNEIAKFFMNVKLESGGRIPKYQTGNSILNNYEPLKKKLLLDSLNKSEKVPEDLTAKSSSTYVSPSIPKYYSENIDPGYIRQSPSRGKQILNNALYYTDNIANVAQLGNFIPNPIAQTVGKIGSGVSTGIDLIQAGMSLNNGDYKSAALNAGWAILSNRLGANSFKRNSKYLKPGQPMYYASPQFFGQLNSNGLPLRTRYIEVFNKTRHMKPGDLSINRALLGGLGAESLYDYDK